MQPGIVPFEQLQQATGYQRQADVERCLKDQGVAVFYGKRGIWTTLDALNAALGVRPANGDDTYPPNEVL